MGFFKFEDKKKEDNSEIGKSVEKTDKLSFVSLVSFLEFLYALLQ